MIEKPKNFRRNGIFPSLSIICLINRGKKKEVKGTHSNNEKTNYKYVNKPPSDDYHRLIK